MITSCNLQTLSGSSTESSSFLFVGAFERGTVRIKSVYGPPLVKECLQHEEVIDSTIQ